MKKTFLNLINPHSFKESESLLKDKISILNIIMLIMGAVVTGFGILRFFQQNHIQAVADFMLIAAIITGFFLLRRNKHHFKPIARFLLLFAFITIFSVLLFSPDVVTRFVWMSTNVFLLFFLLDRKEGWTWFASIMALMIVLYGYDPALFKLSPADFIIFLFSQLLVAVLLSQYETIKEKNEQHYITSTLELKEAVDEKTRELSAQKKMFETLYEKSHDGVLIIEDQKFIDCNEAVVEMLGYASKGAFLNTHPSALSPEFQPDGEPSSTKADRMMAKCLGEGSNHFEWVHKKADGNTFWCDVTLTRLSVGERKLIHVVWRDISEQKALEFEIAKVHESLEKKVLERTRELEHAMQAKADFLANMSHEIRTPLNAMLGFIEILKKDEKQQSRIKQFDIIYNSGQSLLTIINDILDFSKIESGKLEIERRPFYTQAPFQEIELLFFEKAQEKGIAVSSHYDSSLPSAVLGDTVRIKQVAANLLSNAIKFTPPGGSISIRLEYEPAAATLRYSVKDNGIGIARENISRVFEAFSQEDTSTTRRFGGTGLGLSISQKLISLMGGEIGVESVEGKGSLFYFTLPAEISDLSDSREPREQTPESQNFSGHLLVAEDNEMNQMLIDVMLSELGITFDIAHNGLEAVEKFKNGRYDLILMDENMPLMNGIEATRQILEIEAADSRTHTPIVAVTANAFKGDKEQFLKSGMDDYLSKPIDYPRFVALLGMYLENKQPH